MNIEATKAHSPIKEFFQIPEVKCALKITAIALATIGALVASTVIFGTPLLGLIVAPIAVIAIAISIITTESPKPVLPTEVPSYEKEAMRRIDDSLASMKAKDEEQRRLQMESDQAMSKTLARANTAVEGFMDYHEELDKARKRKTENQSGV